MDNEAEKLNPAIAQVQIGTRKLRSIHIYPLSIADQKTMTKSIADTLNWFYDQEGKETELSDISFVNFMVETVLNNIVEFLRMTTEYTKKREVDTLLADITNDQAVEISHMIYTQNYETALKNAMSLLDKIKSTFPSKRPSPPFANDTNTDLSISTDLASIKEELPTGN